MKHLLFFLSVLVLSIAAVAYFVASTVGVKTEDIAPVVPQQDTMVTLAPDLRTILRMQYPDIGADVVDAYVTKVNALNTEFGYSATGVPPIESGKLTVMEEYATRIESIKKELGIEKKLERPSGDPATYLPPPLITVPTEGGSLRLPTATPALQPIQNQVKVPAAPVMQGEQTTSAKTPPLVQQEQPAPPAASTLMQ